MTSKLEKLKQLFFNKEYKILTKEERKEKIKMVKKEKENKK